MAPQSQMVRLRGYAVISMIVPSNLSSVNELSADFKARTPGMQLALQVLDGNLLTNRQPLVAIRAEVDAGKVAPQGSVRGELVQLGRPRCVVRSRSYAPL